MGTVKYTGPVASFHCPTNAEIRSLKVHFSPKQEGSGDPSPENVRPIVGWDGVEVQQTGKNLINMETLRSGRYINGEWSVTNTWRTTDFIPVKPGVKYTISSNNAPTSLYTYQYDKNKKYIENSYTTTLSTITTKDNCQFIILTGSASSVLSATRLMFNEGETFGHFEPYHGTTTNYEFGVLGKNKFNWNVSASESSPVGSDPSTAREFTLNTYVIGMSVNNYYRQNYANWVLNPSVENGVISFSSGGASAYGIAFPLKLAAGQTYFLSGTGNGSAGATYYNENGELISYQSDRLNKTITVPENAATTLIGFYASSTNTNFTFSNIQLELNSTATAYEPYDPKHTVYGGWVDLISGEVQEEWGSSKCGDLSWNRSTTTNTYYYYEATISNKARTKEAMCAKYKSHDVSRSNLQNYDLGYYYPSGTYYHRIAIRDDTYNDLESFISDNTNTLIYYEVTTPIIYQLAPTQLQTFLGQNNVWSNADYVEVEYDLHETQDILARKQFIVANQPHIVSPTAAPLQNFVTDMTAPLKECKVEFKPVQDLHGYDKPWVGGGGKNLFNINASMQDPSDTTLSNSTKRIFTPNTYSVGASYSNWWQPNKITDYSISNGSITVTSSTGYGVCFAIKAKPETYYTVSATVVGDNPRINNAYYDSEGNYLGSASTGGSITTFQTVENTDMMIIIFAQVNNTEATFSNIQVEEGSAATSYEPYENICPISGWTELEAYKTGKSLARFADSVGPTNRHYNGFSGWLLDGYWKIPDRTQTYTYSVYIDNRNAESDSCVNVWFRNETNTAYVRTVNGSKVKAGETGWSTLTFHNSNYYFAGLGISLQIGGVAKSGIVEIGDTTSTYEPYSGETIPMTFPSVINILNSNTITTNKTLSSAGEETSENGMSLTNYIKVNEGETYKLTFTSKEGARTRRIYSYDSNKNPIESLASTSWVTVDTIGSIQATIPSGVEYIRVCYKTADENVFLEGPESSVVYGGHVDLVKGEIVAEWIVFDMTQLDLRQFGTGTSVNTISAFPGTIKSRNAMYCNILTPTSNPNISGVEGIDWNNGRVNICLSTSRGLDSQSKVEQWLNDLKNNGITPLIVANMSTPVIYSIDPQTLKSLHGTNNIWSNTNGNIELKYWTH